MTDPLLDRLLGGTYRIVRLLGQGGMGAVYEARHEALSRTVAVKVLAPEVAALTESLSRLQREAVAAAQLGHPNIIDVTDFRAQPGEPAFLVMEYLRGVGVDVAIERDGCLQPARVARFAYQALGALAAAHAAGIIHRDIKPANLFLTEIPGSGELLKVLDFGIAKAGDGKALTQFGSLIGSPLYMSPEQAFSSDVDGRADLYSLGATMYHALSGRVPLEADNLPAMLLLLGTAVPAPLPPTVDRALAAVVMRALAKTPEARFATAEEMRDALEPFTGMSPSSAGIAPRAAAAAPRRQPPARTAFATPLGYRDSTLNSASQGNLAAAIAAGQTERPPAPELPATELDPRVSYPHAGYPPARGGYVQAPGSYGAVAAQGLPVAQAARATRSTTWIWLLIGAALIVVVTGAGAVAVVTRSIEQAELLQQLRDARDASPSQPSSASPTATPAEAEEETEDDTTE
jgi:Protein kinase domain